MRKQYGTVRLRADDKQWEIQAQPDVMIRLKRILPRVQATRTGSILVADTDEVSHDLEWILGRWPMDLDGGAKQHLQGRADNHRDRVEQVTKILSGTNNLPALPMEPAIELRPYQRQAYALAVAGGGLLLADELGLGKTASALQALSNPELRPALVVTLTGLERQWVRELKKFFPDLRAAVAKKASPHELTDNDGRDPDLIVMNYAKLAGWSDHLRGVAKSVMFDEVQELRRSGSQKHSAAAAVADAADFRIGLSATPVYNFGGEMHSIMSVLRPGMLGGANEFAREWCTSTYGLDPKTRVSDPAAFRSYLQSEGAMLRRTRPEVGIQLPPARLVEQFVEADEKALADAQGNAVEIARLILDASTSRQDRFLASGDFDWRMRQATGLAKAPFVAEFVRLLLESEERIVLMGWHRSVYDLWQEKLAEFNPVMYTGSESPTQKAAAFDAFTSGDARVLIMSLRSGAGLDGLQDVAKVVVFGELDWSPGVHKQVVGRLHRPGQQEPVLAYFCVSEHGADPVMLDVLNIKSIEADLLVDPECTSGLVPVEEASHIRRLAEAVIAGRPTHRVTTPQRLAA